MNIVERENLLIRYTENESINVSGKGSSVNQKEKEHYC